MIPKVSICIPAYNRRGMFRAALWSVLRQTYRDFEVVISDNASEENLEAEVVAANDSRVRYIRRERNYGGPDNFFFLQTLPKGEYVLFLCSDDLLLPDCLEKAVAALEAQPERGGAVYRAAHYSVDGFKYLSNMPDRDFASAAEYTADRAVRDFRFTSPSLCLYRRTAFEWLGGWNKSLIAVVDWELYSRMVRLGGGMIFLHDVLAIMRLHKDQDSNTTALHWGFYHDVMLLAARPEHRWGNAYRARVVVEQLLWDWRLKRSPWRTLKHAYRTKAVLGVLLYLPWEIARRFGLKMRTVFDRRMQARAEALKSPGLPSHFDLDAFNRFWQASEAVRQGR